MQKLFFPKDFSLGSLLRVYIRGCNVFVYRKSKTFGSEILLTFGPENPKRSSEEANKHVFGQLGVRSIRWRKKNFKTILKIKNIETKTFFKKFKKTIQKNQKKLLNVYIGSSFIKISYKGISFIKTIYKGFSFIKTIYKGFDKNAASFGLVH